ncbi:hypothetical protein EVAR_95391_1 [Eumeta japonica]|uniref:Uncharacterized protein n=1 Tax=Eumeta variegata TaxID=151549 RepID=A0A4C1VIY9_EUMVA|nr:hypothetical protein EVAR_95391_1 [Eumeta japonica]
MGRTCVRHIEPTHRRKGARPPLVGNDFLRPVQSAARPSSHVGFITTLGEIRTRTAVIVFITSTDDSDGGGLGQGGAAP